MSRHQVPPTISASAEQVMQHNREVFEDLLQRAMQEWERQEITHALALAQAAANWAWHHHTGTFASRLLEDLLLEIGRSLHRPASQAVQPRSGVLHVLTEGYDVGGHTRLAARWIARDTRVSSIALTQQHRGSIPSTLTSAIAASGGSVSDLRRAAPDLIGRAIALRRLADQHEFVVMHIHPFDVVPLLALADLEVPVVFVNQADHVFWIGARVSNVVMNLRSSGDALATRRRGLPDGHQFVLPLPLEVGLRERSPRQPGQGTLALTIAAEYKYGLATPNEYVEMLLALVRRDEALSVIVIGPENRGEWARASQLSGGRIRPLGIRREIEPFYEQADLYLDSFPFASLTSLLEAASYALPVVSLGGVVTHDVLRSDDPDLPPELISVSSVETFIDRVLYLANHPKEAAAVGQELQVRLVSGRSDEVWQRRLEELYTLSASTARINLNIPAQEYPDEVDNRLIQLQEGVASLPFDRIWLISSETLPMRSRLRYYLAFQLQGKKVSLAALLSENQLTTVIGWKRRLSNLVSAISQNVFSEKVLLKMIKDKL